VIGHPADALFEEMADLAARFHWSREELMSLTHHERRRWLREAARIEAREAAREVEAQDGPWH
jgi:Phage P2 GpE